MLNEQSGRRTANLVALDRGDRFFGNEAKPLEVRSPRTTALDNLALLGRVFGYVQFTRAGARAARVGQTSRAAC